MCAFGRREAAASRHAATLAGHVRVGFQRNLHLPDGSIVALNGEMSRRRPTPAGHGYRVMGAGASAAHHGHLTGERRDGRAFRSLRPTPRTRGSSARRGTAWPNGSNAIGSEGRKARRSTSRSAISGRSRSSAGGGALTPFHRALDRRTGGRRVPLQPPEPGKTWSIDFFCAPFAKVDVEEAPLHGWPANTRWNLAGSHVRGAGSATARGYELAKRVDGRAQLVKDMMLRDGYRFAHHVPRVPRAGPARWSWRQAMG